MADVGDDPSGRLLAVLQEVETLKRSLEEEQQNSSALIQQLQDKLEEKEANVEFEIVEEKLKLAESELELVVERAERAENQVENLQEQIKELEAKLEEKTAAPPPPPMPPPPPPPPPMMPGIMNMNNGGSSIKLITRERLQSVESGNGSAVCDMENMLGLAKKPAQAVQQPGLFKSINCTFVTGKIIFNCNMN